MSYKIDKASSEKIVKISPRGDDVKCFQDILKLIPDEREDLLGYVVYLRNEFIDQLNLNKKPYDIGLWSDEEWEYFLETGIRPQ